MTERIRWTAMDGTVVSWFGYVGSVKTPLFQILHPVTQKPSRSRYDEWVLCATFVGADTARYAESREPEDAVAELKTEAEHLLSEFVSSLGAVFPKPENCGCPPADPPYCGFCGKPRHEVAAVKAAGQQEDKTDG